MNTDLHGYARGARGSGLSWREVAESLGVRNASATFEMLADRSADDLSFRWECGTCHHEITDRGPGGANPAGNETGHGEKCARHAKDVAAYLAKRKSHL